ncbi:MAG: hypothetical protein M3245_04350, partial [Actinomycetota bacterium]|nr:hypothetical protein [Actinomycetota bacterium]
MKRTLSVLAALSVLALPVAPGGLASATEEAMAAGTAVTALSGTDSGGAMTVTGTATFGGERPVQVGEDPEGDPPVAAHTARLGVDITGVSIHRPDPAANEVQFVWKLARLDATPPPEVVRYLWQMKIGEKEFWIQAKTSDFLSGTNVADD